MISPAAVRRSVRTGLVAGGVIVYLAATGILERFNTGNIIADVLRLGELLIFAAMFGAGYVASRKREEGAHAATNAIGGLIAGAGAGALPALFLLLMRGLLNAEMNVRDILVSVSPRLLGEILSFGQSTVAGALVLLGVGAVLGLLGGAIHLLPAQVRRPLGVGLVAVLLAGLLQEMLSEILDNLQLERDWLVRRAGLTLTGAIVVFLVAAGLSMAWAFRGEMARRKIGEMPADQRKAARTAGLVVLIALLLFLPNLVGRFYSDVLGIVGLYVLLGLGLNIVVGYAGLLDLGYVAFFAVGAYATAVFTSPASFLVTEEGQAFADGGLTNFWFALPAVIIVAVVIGILIGAPVLRLRGDYLAIVTLGFGEIVRTLFLSDWLQPFFGGAQGIIQVPAPPPGSLDLRDAERIYYLILAFVLVAAFVSFRLANSRVGRAWAAMREDESVAEAMGISVIKYKLLAFAMGAAIGCLGGTFFAAKIGSIFPNSFGLLVSINVLAVIILGGMGSIPGVIVGALVLVGLPEVLREIVPPEYRLLVYGAILVAIMIYRPEGLLPNVRRRRELHGEEAEEDQYERGAPAAEPVVVTGTATPTGREGSTP
jgi:branched-chain amino acid transport system permease protein